MKSCKTESFTIGKIALETGVGIETIRFYEGKGLIEEPPRLESGYRQYPRETISRLRFIKKAKALGFTLKEIMELLELRIEPGATCKDIRLRAKTKMSEIESKIAALTEMNASLEQLIQTCGDVRSMSECPIIESLEAEEDDEGR
ncbi:MAG: MerR family DNA-binding protein [Opitutaceae bacterium]|nr:MerR family DNA-binding protein [Opitutaceae bacterium]